MKNRKIAVVALSLILLVALGVGSTLAYFTDTHSATNVVTMGKVDITLTEEGNGEPIDGGMEFKNVLPGDNLVKKPIITVTDDSQSAYVAVELKVVTNDTDATYKKDIEELEKAIINRMVDSGKWTKNEGNAETWLHDSNSNASDSYIYCKDILKANDTVTLFETVEIPAEWGNEAAGKGFEIQITAYAVQADNYTPFFAEEPVQQ